MKKLLITTLIVTSFVGFLLVVAPGAPHVSAQSANDIGKACNLPDTTFFGIPTWYKYLDGQEDAFGKCTPHVNLDANSGGGFKQLLPIGLAIIDMLLRVAGLVAVGFIVYAGFQYVTSQGEPQATTQAKDGIINAIVGLVIVILASAIVAFIGGRLK